MSHEEIVHYQNAADITKGIIGCGATMLGIITSHLGEIEAWLRITSLVIGIAVGIATFISIRRRK